MIADCQLLICRTRSGSDGTIDSAVSNAANTPQRGERAIGSWHSAIDNR